MSRAHPDCSIEGRSSDLTRIALRYNASCLNTSIPEPSLPHGTTSSDGVRPSHMLSTRQTSVDQWLPWLGIELGTVSFKEKVVSAVGGILAILGTMLICIPMVGGSTATGLIASMGATAVLLFGVPHGPLSQPWPVIAGHGLSAIIGVACARWIPFPSLAAALAVGISLGVMHQLRCIHPPGGATALTAALASPEIRALGFQFVWTPVLLNVLVMLAMAVAFNACFRWRRYPARFNTAPTISPLPREEAALSHDSIVRALQSLDSFVDISEEDLRQLVRILSSGSSGDRNPPPQHPNG